VRHSRLLVSGMMVAVVAILAIHGCERPSPPTESTNGPAGARPSTQVAALRAATAGQWSAPFSWAHVAVHAHLTPDGKVLTWSGYESTLTTDSMHTLDTDLWDPATGAFTKWPTLTTDIFCSGHAFLGDGTLLVAGGHIADNMGSNHTNTFSYLAPGWIRRGDMAAGRWYPTVTTLADGRAVALSGNTEQNTRNLVPEVWNGTSWTPLTTASVSLPYYPWSFVAPDGRVFVAGSNPTARLLNTSGTGSWTIVATGSFGWRDYGTAVMYEPGKVLVLGGSTSSTTPPTNTAETIDLNVAAPAWRPTSAMTYPRRHPNATILADGTVLVTGGTSATGFNNPAGAVFAAELWDPATGKWTILSSMKIPRMYHSVALLLPDGRVLSAGGGRCGSCAGADHSDAELFSPPYLSAGQRPTITAAPLAIGYGQSFTVQTPDAPHITKVTLVRLSSVTHAFNMNQRFNVLPIVSQGGSTVVVTAPARATLAPPGHYMLFIITGKHGVPSVAKIVKLG
jgi:galactose oxidase